jgi:hypothetical protein
LLSFANEFLSVAKDKQVNADTLGFSALIVVIKNIKNDGGYATQKTINYTSLRILDLYHINCEFI